MEPDLQEHRLAQGKTLPNRALTLGLVANALRQLQAGRMLYLALKAALSGILIAVISEVSKRYPGLGALIASLPLVSVLGMIWLWNDKPDATNMAVHSQATFWFVLPSLPMFLLIAAMLRNGFGFWVSLLSGCALTVALYASVAWLGPRFGLRL